MNMIPEELCLVIDLMKTAMLDSNLHMRNFTPLRTDDCNKEEILKNVCEQIKNIIIKHGRTT